MADFGSKFDDMVMADITLSIFQWKYPIKYIRSYKFQTDCPETRENTEKLIEFIWISSKWQI